MAIDVSNYTCPKCGQRFERLDEGFLMFSDIVYTICECEECHHVFSSSTEGENYHPTCPKCGGKRKGWDYSCPQCGSLMQQELQWSDVI